MKPFAAQILTTLLVLLYLPTLQAAVETGKPLPVVEASIKEIIPSEKDAALQKARWQGLAELNDENKVYTLYHLSPRMGIDALHKPYFDLVESAGIVDRHQTITIVNLKEAMFGTSGMVISELKKNAIKHPSQRFLLDKQSAFKQAWQLDEKSAAIILVDSNGSVLAMHRGKITTEQAEPLVELLKQRLEQ